MIVLLLLALIQYHFLTMAVCQPQVLLPRTLRSSGSKFQSSTDNTLYTPLPKRFIESVDLNSATLCIKREFNVTVTTNTTNTIQAGNNEVFLPYDEERYVLINSEGGFEELTPDKFRFTNGNKELRIFGVSTLVLQDLLQLLIKQTLLQK